LLLRDKKLGHSNQVEGLALCIARLTKVEVDRVEVQRRRGFPGNTVRRYVMRRYPGMAHEWLRRFYGVEVSAVRPPDVLLGSGDATIPVGIHLSRMTGAKFILAGDPKDFDTRDIGLVIVHSPRVAGEPNCVFAPIPCTVDPDRLPIPRPLRTDADLAGAEISLLLGGRGRGYVYTEVEWRALAAFVVAVKRAFGVRWSVVNSPRTPEVASDVFAALAAAGDLARFVDFRRAGPGSVGEFFKADAIVVTEDSRSMMAESLAARRPVVLMRPKLVTHSLGTERIAATVAGGGAAVLPILSATAEQFARVLLSLRIAARDPRDVIAAAIAPVLGLSAPGEAECPAARAVFSVCLNLPGPGTRDLENMIAPVAVLFANLKGNIGDFAILHAMLRDIERKLPATTRSMYCSRRLFDHRTSRSWRRSRRRRRHSNSSAGRMCTLPSRLQRLARARSCQERFFRHIRKKAGPIGSAAMPGRFRGYEARVSAPAVRDWGGRGRGVDVRDIDGGCRSQPQDLRLSVLDQRSGLEGQRPERPARYFSHVVHPIVVRDGMARVVMEGLGLPVTLGVDCVFSMADLSPAIEPAPAATVRASPS
jgi:mitochondrial fission protein ELM1